MFFFSHEKDRKIREAARMEAAAKKKAEEDRAKKEAEDQARADAARKQREREEEERRKEEERLAKQAKIDGGNLAKESQPKDYHNGRSIIEAIAKLKLDVPIDRCS